MLQPPGLERRGADKVVYMHQKSLLPCFGINFGTVSFSSSSIFLVNSPFLSSVPVDYVVFSCCLVFDALVLFATYLSLYLCLV